MYQRIKLHSIEAVAVALLFSVYTLIFLPVSLIAEQVTTIHVMLFSVLMIGGHVLFASLKIWWKYRGKCIPEENAADLHGHLKQLSDEMGVKHPRLIILDTPVPNAYATDAIPTRPIVILTTGLLDTVTTEELRAIMAHEISHIKSHDVYFMAITSSVISMIRRVHNVFRRGVIGNPNKGHQIVLFIPFAVTRVALEIGRVVFFAISRTREYIADRDAADATSPTAMRSALARVTGNISSLSEEEIKRFPGDQPLCIAPLTDLQSRLYNTHPPTDRRIDVLSKE